MTKNEFLTKNKSSFLNQSNTNSSDFILQFFKNSINQFSKKINRQTLNFLLESLENQFDYLKELSLYHKKEIICFISDLKDSPQSNCTPIQPYQDINLNRDDTIVGTVSTCTDHVNQLNIFLIDIFENSRTKMDSQTPSHKPQILTKGSYNSLLSLYSDLKISCSLIEKTFNQYNEHPDPLPNPSHRYNKKSPCLLKSLFSESKVNSKNDPRLNTSNLSFSVEQSILNDLRPKNKSLPTSQKKQSQLSIDSLKFKKNKKTSENFDQLRKKIFNSFNSKFEEKVKKSDSIDFDRDSLLLKIKESSPAKIEGKEKKKVLSNQKRNLLSQVGSPQLSSRFFKTGIYQKSYQQPIRDQSHNSKKPIRNLKQKPSFINLKDPKISSPRFLHPPSQKIANPLKLDTHQNHHHNIQPPKPKIFKFSSKLNTHKADQDPSKHKMRKSKSGIQDYFSNLNKNNIIKN